MEIGKSVSRLGILGLATLLLATPSAAYYHYVHFNRNTLGSPIQEKFDLNVLGPAKTVTFLVNDQGPASLAPGDSFGSILGELKQALAAWDSVSTSDLRVAFGGLETAGQKSNSPGGDVIFQDLPPGLLGQGAPTVAVGTTTIIGGTVILSNNTARGPGPSFHEAFFTTAVHEVGHALGLQHTWTGSAMSQDIIRNTSRARKMDADDVAAISVLYGHPGWQSNYGSISGRVTFTNGQPVSLASVVAISASGPAVSALTNPDGTYRIDGLPALNNYYLYVHPLPPDAIVSDGSGLRLPVDQNGAPIPDNGKFGTVFYPGTTDSQSAPTFQINRGTVLTGRDFSVRPQASVPMYDIATYSYLDPGTRSAVYSAAANSIGVKPAFVNNTQGPFAVVAEAFSGDTPVPQSVTLLGGFGTASGQYLVPFFDTNFSQRALILYFAMPLGAGTGPRHMVFNIGNDMYVLPNAVNLTQKGAPVISSVNPNPDGSVTVTGSGFGGDSLVFFDGWQSTIQTPFSGSDALGSITVLPPQGSSGQVSNITVFNGDGQNSTFLQPQSYPTYTYPAAAPPQVSIDRTSLTAGATAVINITGQNTHFVDGQVTLGFGTDDVTVQHLWVNSSTQMQANVAVAQGAALGTSEISVISGFQIMTNAGPFQVQPSNASLPVVTGVLNANLNQQTIYPGSSGSVLGVNLQGIAQLTINDVPATITLANSTQINFQIPPSFPSGLATLKLIGGTASSNPVLVQIANPPPTIQNVTNISGVPYDSTHFASASDVVNVYVTGLEPSVINSPSRLQVTVSGVPMPIQYPVTAAPNNQFLIQFNLTQSFGGQQVPLAVLVDGSSSTTVQMTVR